MERLHLAQYAPIVILIDVENRARIRELRAKAGAPSISSRKLIEQMHKIKKNYSHLLTGTNFYFLIFLHLHIFIIVVICFSSTNGI